MENKSKAFACVVSEKGEVFWRKGVDNTWEINCFFWEKTRRVRTAFVNMVPRDGDYRHLDVNKCPIVIDGDTPSWWNYLFESKVRDAFNEWKTWLYSVMDVTKYPKNPFFIKAPKIEERHIELLRNYGDGLSRDNIQIIICSRIEESIIVSLYDLISKTNECPRENDFTYRIGQGILYVQLGYMFVELFRQFYKEDINYEYPNISVIKLLQEGLIPSGGGPKLFGSVLGNGISECLYEDK